MKISPAKLESPRLIIRTYTLADAASLFGLIDSNKELLADYFPMSVESATSVMATRKYILERNSDRKSGKSLFAGIFMRDDKTLVGQICAKDINWRVPKSEVGYFLDKNYFGKGFGSEAVDVFCKHCFKELQMAKITLRIEPKNLASKKLAKKCGFKCIGVSGNDFRSTAGRLMDCELWEKISN